MKDEDRLELRQSRVDFFLYFCLFVRENIFYGAFFRNPVPDVGNVVPQADSSPDVEISNSKKARHRPPKQEEGEEEVGLLVIPPDRRRRRV